jgi:hypothetical protein
MATKPRIRAREFNGPSPHAVAILARNPSKVPLDNLILQNRKKDEQLSNALERTQEHQKVDMQINWERNTTKKIIANTVQRRFNEKVQHSNMQLEDRRQALRQMLAEEDYYYLQKAHSMKETMEQKQERMRSKAAMLKSRRESEREAIVKSKLDQQWQNQCEELRSVLTRKHQDQVCMERGYQLNQQAERERERQAEEALYAELWERDRLAKAAREEREAEDAMNRNYKQLDILQTQRKENAIRAEAAKGNIHTEAQQLQLDREQLQAEIAKNKNFEKHGKMKYTKSLMRQITLKELQQKRENEEELALDLKIVKSANQEKANEEIEILQSKVMRREQEANYREYLKTQRQLELEREAEIERIIEADVQVQETKKADARKKKKLAHATFLQDVLSVRAVQVDLKRKERNEEQAGQAKERERINKIMEEHATFQRSQFEYQRNKNRDYSSDLLSQMDFQESIREQQRELDKREYENGLLTEQAYEARLREVLERSDIQQGHPLRQIAQQKSETQIFK